LVCIFSLIWGCGSVGFGLACKIAGVGMGTNLTIGVVTVLGALLPLILNRVIKTTSGIIVLVGLAVCCVGLFFSMKSLQIRDRQENDAPSVSTDRPKDDPTREIEEGPKQYAEFSARNESIVSATESQIEKGAKADQDRVRVEAVESTPSTPPDGDDCDRRSTLFKVTVCVVAGVLATQLQFAFVFGQSMIDLAESDMGPSSTPPSGSAAVIWLFAFTVSAPVSLLYGLYNTCHQWRKIVLCGAYRHGLIFLTVTLPWVSHIHLYGISNTILPEKMAAAVSWPVLMMITVLTGVIWSFLLGEWNQTSAKALQQLFIGLTFILSGIAILILSFLAN
jgi:L-rhamnose-proton symport protein (RhaT)